MMARDFTLVMVGLVFALVTLNPVRFDLLPDAIGYGLIAVAAHNLAQYATKFHIARNLAVPLVALSLLAYVTPEGPTLVLHLINAILTILLVWFLLGAVVQFTRERDRPDLAKHAMTYRRIYLGIAIFGFFIQWAAQVQPEGTEGFVGIMTVAILAILFFILRLLVIVRHDLAIDLRGIV